VCDLLRKGGTADMAVGAALIRLWSRSSDGFSEEFSEEFSEVAQGIEELIIILFDTLRCYSMEELLDSPLTQSWDAYL
jgi:hypothetical protein